MTRTAGRTARMKSPLDDTCRADVSGTFARLQCPPEAKVMSARDAGGEASFYAPRDKAATHDFVLEIKDGNE